MLSPSERREILAELMRRLTGEGLVRLARVSLKDEGEVGKPFTGLTVVGNQVTPQMAAQIIDAWSSSGATTLIRGLELCRTNLGTSFGSTIERLKTRAGVVDDDEEDEGGATVISTTHPDEHPHFEEEYTGALDDALRQELGDLFTEMETSPGEAAASNSRLPEESTAAIPEVVPERTPPSPAGRSPAPPVFEDDIQSSHDDTSLVTLSVFDLGLHLDASQAVTDSGETTSSYTAAVEVSPEASPEEPTSEATLEATAAMGGGDPLQTSPGGGWPSEFPQPTKPGTEVTRSMSVPPGVVQEPSTTQQLVDDTPYVATLHEMDGAPFHLLTLSLPPGTGAGEVSFAGLTGKRGFDGMWGHLAYALLNPGEGEGLMGRPMTWYPVRGMPRSNLKLSTGRGHHLRDLLPEAPAGTHYLPPGEYVLPRPDGTRLTHLLNRGLWLATTPVTHSQFVTFLGETGYKPENQTDFLRHMPGGHPPEGLGPHPVLYVDMEDARAYARWVGARLPTEEELTCAMVGFHGWPWPWGGNFDPTRTNTRESRVGSTLPVGSRPTGAGPFGHLDLTGNVWSWTDSLDPRSGVSHQRIKGGAWVTDSTLAHAGVWGAALPETRQFFLGFRVIWDKAAEDTTH